MLTKIKLYGHLRELTGNSSFDAKVSNTAEAVRFLVSNFPLLEHEMANQYYRVSVNNVDIDKTELHDPVGIAEIKIIPVIAGSGRGFGKILLGAALIGLSFLSFPMAGGGMTAGLGVGFAKGFAKVSLISKTLAYVGAYLVLSGISDLFTPEQKPEAEDPLSASFSNAVNTTLATVPIPIVYGEYIVGSIVASAGIDTSDLGESDNTPTDTIQGEDGNTISIPLNDDQNYISSFGMDTNNFDNDEDPNELTYYRIFRKYNSTSLSTEVIFNGTHYPGEDYPINSDDYNEILDNFKNNNKNQFNFGLPVNGPQNEFFYPGSLQEDRAFNGTTMIPNQDAATCGVQYDEDDEDEVTGFNYCFNGFLYSVIRGTQVSD